MGMGEEESLVAALKYHDPAAIEALIETGGLKSGQFNGFLYCSQRTFA